MGDALPTAADEEELDDTLGSALSNEVRALV